MIRSRSLVDMEQQRRRIPIRSVVGPTPAATEALRLACYVREVERQALAYCDSWGEAQDAARAGEVETTWHRLQGALFAAIIVSRLVTTPADVRGWPAIHKADGKRLAQAAAEKRVTALRKELRLPDQPGGMVLDQVKVVRDSLEHVDQRLDHTLSLPNVHSLADWYLSDGLILVSEYDGAPSPQPPGQRAFFPEGGLLFFDNERLDLLTLEVEMLGLVHYSRTARADLLAAVPGRLEYGGGYLVPYGAAADEERLADLRRQRHSRLDAMAAAGEDRAVIWMEVSTPPQDSDPTASL